MVMQRSASQALRFKLRVAVCPAEDRLPQFNNPRLSVQQPEAVLRQFVVLVSPYDAVSDLRRVILETYSKLYPEEPAICFGLLKDAQMFDIDESFVVGEVFEPSEVVKVILSSGSLGTSGLLTPNSKAISPVESGESMLVCPAPKIRKLNPEDLLTNEIANVRVIEKESEPFQKIEENPVSSESSESEEESETESDVEESGTESEEEESDESEVEEAVVIPSSLPLPSGRPSDRFESIDDQIAAQVDSEYSSSELEVNASSSEEESDETSSNGTESDESESEAEPTAIVAPAASESSSEYESTSEEEATVVPTVTAQVSSDEEDEEENSGSEESSSEEESESAEESEAEMENKPVEESSSSSSSDESSDELVLPGGDADVKQVLKRVPKYTSLTSLNDCLSQAVSGRATPLLPKTEAAKAQEPLETKGRVRLPRRKTNNSGYDASLFS